MRRREFLRSVMAAGLAGPAAMNLRNACGASERPNVVVLLTDDQRFDTIRALGNPHIHTPNMDRLVREGTAMTRAHIMGAQSPAVCAPSRAAFITGRGIFEIPDSVVVPWSVPAEDRGPSPHKTFPQVFGEAGYDTYFTGKWHNGPAVFQQSFKDGGNIFFGGMSDHLQVPVHEYAEDGSYGNDTTHMGEKFSSELFSDSAVGFLESRGEQDNPFLLYVSYTAPHDPRMAPAPYASMYDPASLPLPPNFMPEHPFDNGELTIRDEKLAPWPRTPAIVREHLAAYYAMITHIDDQIGRVLDALDAQGLADNTIVVFGGDNGLAVGQHGLLGKQNLYEHSMRVPLIFRGTGIPAGERRGALCYLHDVYPTIGDLCGVEVPASVTAQSLQTAIADGDFTRSQLLLAYRDFQRGVRVDRWKYIRYSVNGVETTQLFDLDADPYETNNLASDGQLADRVARLDATMIDLMHAASDEAGLANFGP